MTRLYDLAEIPREPELEILEYDRTLGQWCAEMNVSKELEASIMNSDMVLIPAGYRDCPKAFHINTRDFYNYCRHIDGIRVEICCEEEDFTQLQLCSLKVRLGKIFLPSTISGALIWSIISGYIKDCIDTTLADRAVPEQTADTPAFQSGPECSFSAIIKDTTGKYIEVKYDGPVSGMEKAGDAIKRIAGDGQEDS